MNLALEVILHLPVHEARVPFKLSKPRLELGDLGFLLVQLVLESPGDDQLLLIMLYY